jgi:hypothetical protein
VNYDEILEPAEAEASAVLLDARVLPARLPRVGQVRLSMTSPRPRSGDQRIVLALTQLAALAWVLTHLLEAAAEKAHRRGRFDKGSAMNYP